MYIGYNVDKINTMMGDLKNAGDQVLENVATKYNDLEVVLRNNWIGPDELDFEKNLISRLSSLDNSIKELIVSSMNNIYRLGCAWADFQDKNTISGESTGMGAQLVLKLDQPRPNWYLYGWKGGVTYKSREFSSTDNLGLADSNSVSTMLTAISTFVDEVNKEVDTIFGQIESSNAFFGEKQSKAVSGYVMAVGDAVAEIKTAIQDFYDAMSVLTKTAYTTADNDVDTSLSTESLVSGVSNGLGASRWGGAAQEANVGDGFDSYRTQSNSF